MSDDQFLFSQKDPTSTDQYQSINSDSYPPYLDRAKNNLQFFLPFHKITVIQKQEDTQSLDNQLCYSKALYSLYITSQQLLRDKYQVWTQAFLEQRTFSLYIRHIVYLNNRCLKINFKNVQSSFFIAFCNSINKKLNPIKLIIHPISGEIWFQNKYLINGSTLSHLKKNVCRNDCYYTQIIFNSIDRAEKFIEIILYLTGQINLSEITNQLIIKEFSFINQGNQIIKILESYLIYMRFINLSEYQQSIKSTNNQGNSNQADYEKYNQLKKIFFQQNKMNIIQQQLQFFTQKIEQFIKIYNYSNQKIYQNVKLNLPLNDILLNRPKITNIKQAKQQVQKVDNYYIEIKRQNILTEIHILNDNLKDHQQYQNQQNQQIKRSQENQKNQQSQQNYINNDMKDNNTNKNKWKTIFQGGFGLIQMGYLTYKVLDHSNQQIKSGYQVVQKQMVKKTDKFQFKSKQSKSIYSKIRRQRKVLNKLKQYSHPNIMKFYISNQQQFENCIFCQYSPHMSMDLYLKKNSLTLTIDKKCSLLLEAIQSLIFLHIQKIIHLDIKPGNFIISRGLKVLLSDFGQAFIMEQDNQLTHRHAYTIPYCAPQIFQNQPCISKQVDIYSIGVCLFKMFFANEKSFELFFKKQFLNSLKYNKIKQIFIYQKLDSSPLAKIYKILMFTAYQTIHYSSKSRIDLCWIRQIIKKSKQYFQSFFSIH